MYPSWSFGVTVQLSATSHTLIVRLVCGSTKQCACCENAAFFACGFLAASGSRSSEARLAPSTVASTSPLRPASSASVLRIAIISAS
mgnify:CR=1 FL=1